MLSWEGACAPLPIFTISARSSRILKSRASSCIYYGVPDRSVRVQLLYLLESSTVLYNSKWWGALTGKLSASSPLEPQWPNHSRPSQKVHFDRFTRLAYRQQDTRQNISTRSLNEKVLKMKNWSSQNVGFVTCLVWLSSLFAVVDASFTLTLEPGTEECYIIRTSEDKRAMISWVFPCRVCLCLCLWLVDPVHIKILAIQKLINSFCWQTAERMTVWTTTSREVLCRSV